MNSPEETQRRIGLPGATGVGVGAIVGGGILALTGVAFATTGPAALVAFGLNGLIALLTALSFAEMASKFPESGGTYTFAKKVLSVEAAFTVGWVVWFASIVAAVLYAVGFAYFALAMAADIWIASLGETPAWLSDPRSVTGLALTTVAFLSIGLVRKAAGGGEWINVGKVAVFAVLIAGGLWAVVRQSPEETGKALSPFFTQGLEGLVQAMGYSFIALQGFDLIAAVGGEVRRPEKTIPRAMLLSLGIALAIYLPLLFVIATVGVPADQSIGEVAAKNQEGIVPLAARNYLGAFGYWLVMVAAVLSMYSALQANLFAASRIARKMADDRTLPARMGRIDPARGTPVAAVLVTGGIVSATLLLLPDVASAGAASSLIFLITFALAHWVVVLVRKRSSDRPPPFRTPLFPLVPAVGGLACAGLALFQGIAVPMAGIIAAVWLGTGGLMFLALSARRARLTDVLNTAYEPELVTLRGRTPLVLVPIANPQNAEAMIALADALVPAGVGRVLLHTVVVAPDDWQPDEDPAPIEKSQQVLRALLRASARLRMRTEALTTLAREPMQEIARVARLHRCEVVLAGFSEIAVEGEDAPLEELLGSVDADVVVLRARREWQLAETKRILVPVAGRGGHEHLLARLLGSLLRTGRREVTFLRVVSEQTTPDEQRRIKRNLKQLAEDELRQRCRVEVVPGGDPAVEIAERAGEFELLILGVQRIGRQQKLFGNFIRRLARETACPLIVMSRRG